MTEQQPLLMPAGRAQAAMFREQIVGWSNFTVPFGLRLKGRLDRDVLLASIDDLFARHEALRTTHRLEGEQVVQLIWPTRTPPLHELHIRTAATGDAALHDEISALLDTPFEMTGWLARVVLVHAGPDDCVLLLLMQHTISDAVSSRVLADELCASLVARHAGGGAPALPEHLQLRDYAAWENTIDGARHAAYWRERIAPTTIAAPDPELSDAPCGVILRTVKAPPLSAATTNQLLEHAARERASATVLLTAVVAAALQPWADDTLRIGLVHANRFEPQFRSVVGSVASILPVRLALDPQLTFPALIANAKREWFGALARRLPCWQLFELAGANGADFRHLFDVGVNCHIGVRRGTEPVTVESPRHGRLTIARYVHPTPSCERVCRWDGGAFGFGFAFALDGAGCLSTTVRADPTRLSEGHVAELGAYLGRVLTHFARVPDAAIGDAVERPPTLFTR